MRIDHIAYRVADRNAAARFFQEALGYKRQDEFEIDFGNGQTAQCIVLEPPGTTSTNRSEIPVINFDLVGDVPPCIFHKPAEIFVSDGSLGSIVGDWVAERGGIGGVHHIAYQVDSVERTMQEWKEKGFAEFTSDAPMKCPGLTQVFTKPSSLTGVIYEFIERGDRGFCRDNVKQLMESTKGL
jgi:4-hydroxyphenylpyruvate dioxygenase-like putative hemolysin